jgi:hypothetical protein
MPCLFVLDSYHQHKKFFIRRLISSLLVFSEIYPIANSTTAVWQAIGINSILNYSKQQILQHTLDTHILINLIRLFVIMNLVTEFRISPAASLLIEF